MTIFNKSESKLKKQKEAKKNENIAEMLNQAKENQAKRAASIQVFSSFFYQSLIKA